MNLKTRILKFFKNIKLKTNNKTEKWVKFILCLSQCLACGFSFKQIKCPNSDFIHMH